MTALGLDDLFALLQPDAKAPVIASSIEEANNGDFLFCSDGMYCKHSRRIGDFIVLESKFPKPVPMVQKGQESFHRNPDMPKIPGYLFNGIIEFYRKIYQTNRNEVMAQIWFNKETNEYLVEVPVQRVAGASISYDRVGRFYEDPNLELVLTSHSHHTMSAFYSGTDNTDEQGKDGIYSFVFGNLINLADNKFTYRTVQRVCFGKSFFPIEIDDIFDFDAEGYYEVPEEEYANVTEVKYTYQRHTGAKTYVPPVDKSYPSNVYNGLNYGNSIYGSSGFYEDDAYAYLYEQEYWSYLKKTEKSTKKYSYSTYGMLNTVPYNVNSGSRNGLDIIFGTTNVSNFADDEIAKIKKHLQDAAEMIKGLESNNPLVTEFLSKMIFAIHRYVDREGAPVLALDDGNAMQDQYEETQEFLAKLALYCYLYACAGVEEDCGMLGADEGANVIYDLIREYYVIL